MGSFLFSFTTLIYHKMHEIKWRHLRCRAWLCIVNIYEVNSIMTNTWYNQYNFPNGSYKMMDKIESTYYPGSFGHTSFFFSYTWLTCVISYRSNVLPIYHDCFTSISRLFNPISLFQPYITIVQTLYHDCTTPLPLFSISISRLFHSYLTIMPTLSND